MAKHVRLLGILAIGLSVILGCQKKTDYLYFNKENRQINYEHKLKELSGNADLDILWVIDNSSSMMVHQNTVIANMNSFVDGLVLDKTLRWKMGLISTTTGEDPYVGFAPNDLLDHTTPNAAQKFKDAVLRLGTDGDVYEKEYDPIVNVLRNYPGFPRPNAYLAIITVSDASEQSRMSTAAFIATMTQIKGNLDNVLFYAFVNPVDWCSPTDDVFNWQGSKLQDLLTKVHGGAFKLCDQNFGVNVANLGSVIAKQITSPKIMLKDKPILSTLRVTHLGVNVKPGPRSIGGYWEYDVNLNAIVFNDLTFAPNDNEAVKVIYEVDDNP
ncbi:MAG: hypothetical protein ACXVA9_02270 [Bdellovibrionales bacterium]